MEERKPFQKLDLFDRFLFDEVMKDDDTCQAMFELVLGENLGKFHHTESEKEFRKSPLFRAVRMDIFARNEQETIFNAEMQTRNTGNLPKRSRFYQAHMDVSLLKPGVINFNGLNDTFIVLIAPFDLFGQDRYCYTFRMRADEDPSLRLNDGITRIFLNTEGRNDSEVSPDLVEFLHYLKVSGQDKPPVTDNARILKIHEQVQKVRANERLEVTYMQAWEEIELARQEGRTEGHTAGVTEGHAAGVAEGHAAGIAEGHAAGIAEGHAAGIAEEKKNFIRFLLHENRSDSDIIKTVRCDQKLIDQVRNEDNTN